MVQHMMMQASLKQVRKEVKVLLSAITPHKDSLGQAGQMGGREQLWEGMRASRAMKMLHILILMPFTWMSMYRQSPKLQATFKDLWAAN